MRKKMMRKILRSIATISRCITYIRGRQFKSLGLNQGQHAFLTRVMENHGINQEEVSYMLKVDKTTSAKALNKLQAKGFITKKRSLIDKRMYNLYPAKELIRIYPEIETKILETAKIGLKDLKVYQDLYQLALEINNLTKKFPIDERFALTNQIRRSSRSICSNIAEAYRKRQYPKHFISKLSDADAELCETLIWLDFSKDLGYIQTEEYAFVTKRYQNIGKMLGGMMKSPEKFRPRRSQQFFK